MAINITVKNTFLDYKLQAAPVRRSTSVPPTWSPVAVSIDNDSNCGKSRHSDEVTRASDKAEACPSIFTDSDYQDWADFSSACTDCAHDYPDSASSWADICEECLPMCKNVQCATCLPDAGIVDVTPDASKEINLVDSGAWCPGAELTKAEKKVILSLTDTVSTGVVRSKLRSQAQLFTTMFTATPTISATPTSNTPIEMKTVLATMVKALAQHKDVSDVQVHDGGMGGRTMVVAESHSDDPDPCMAFAVAKDALLGAAEKSENTYVLGYGAEPFQKLDTLSFSTKIACVPAAQQETCCWDTYESGFCPRSGACIWDHPSEVDMMRIIVMMKKRKVQLHLGDMIESL